MSQDWMSFLSGFVDRCKELGMLFEARQLSQQEIIDIAGEYFIEAHAYDEPKLHEAMRNAWQQIQLAMEKIQMDWEEEKGFTKDDLYRRYMGELFLDMRLMNASRIPVAIRASFWYLYQVEVEGPYLH